MENELEQKLRLVEVAIQSFRMGLMSSQSLAEVLELLYNALREKEVEDRNQSSPKNAK
jgi:hypothetical protein